MCSGWEESGFWRPVHEESFLQCGPCRPSSYSQKAVQDQEKDLASNKGSEARSRHKRAAVALLRGKKAAHSSPCDRETEARGSLAGRFRQRKLRRAEEGLPSNYSTKMPFRARLYLAPPPEEPQVRQSLGEVAQYPALIASALPL